MQPMTDEFAKKGGNHGGEIEEAFSALGFGREIEEQQGKRVIRIFQTFTTIQKIGYLQLSGGDVEATYRFASTRSYIEESRKCSM
jgi:hypothetical protein